MESEHSMGELASACLALHDVEISYGRQPVIKHLNLTVRTGEIVCLVGGSGSGKTTLLQAIGGLIETSQGTIEIDGSPIRGPGPDRAMVFQDDAVFPWYTVMQNVEYSIKLRKVPADVRRAEAARHLAMVGLTQAADLYPRQLSGGMRKRVDMARALAANPRIVLMDEPYAALDAFTKARLQRDFLQLCETQQITSVFVTHDLEEALYVGDHIAILQGRPSSISDVMSVPFAHPRSPDIRMEPEFQRLRGVLEREIEMDWGTVLDGTE